MFAAVALVAAALALGAAPAGATDYGAGAPIPYPLFPTDNAWNVRVDTLPLDPDSDHYIAHMSPTTGLHPDFGTVWEGNPIGIPYVVVPGDQPLVAIDFYYPDESDPGPYPIPPDAPVEGNGIDGDCHVLVLDSDHQRLYEVYDAHKEGAVWHAGSGALFNLASNALRPDTWTSADAAGLPILPGLVRYDEAVGEGVIDHALRFTVAQTQKAHIYPATHDASSLTDTDLPPMGLRVRLKASYDISGFPPEVRVVLQALKTYGMMLADNGSNWFISGAPDARWDDEALSAMRAVKGSDFEVVDSRYLEPGADPTPPVVAVTAPGAGQTWYTGSSQTVAWTVSSAVSAGEFKVWLVSAAGGWYGGRQVLPVVGQLSYSTQVTASAPAGVGYKAFVYWRPTVGSGAWLATAKSAAFTIAARPLITVSAPAAGALWQGGSTRTVSWSLDAAVAAGEFRVWLVSPAGAWYGGKQVLPAAGATTYSTGVPVSAPPGTGYRAAVYWRPDVGSGAWLATARSAAFSVAALTVTSPTAASSWAIGSSQTISWTITPTVAVGEFKVWLVSAAGAWYFGKVVPAVAGQPSYSAAVTLNAAGMTAGSYKPYVYYRPTVGSGAWTIQTIGAAFPVTGP